MSKPVKKVVVAYSGGLDTSVIIQWLLEAYPGCEVIAFAADVGQKEELDGLEEKALRTGASKCTIEDLREEFARDFVFPMLRANAIYEGTYLMGTSIARPLIAKKQIEIAHREKADAVCHGATGKGNDQCRFQLAAEALEPGIQVVTPWRRKAFRDKFPGRSEMIAYCSARKIPVKASVSKPYSSDENCLHISYEAGKLEDLTVNGVELVEFGMTVSPQQAPDKIENVKVAFEAGVPVAVNGHTGSAYEIVQKLNEIGGRNGVGRVDMVENRFVGMKSRGVYESPGMTILYESLRLLEQVTLDRELMHLRDRLAPEVAELVYYGFWYAPKMDALFAFIRQAHRTVTGEVSLNLYKGNLMVAGRQSPYSLYDEGIATMEGGGSYNQDDAEGFLRIQGLPGRVQARVTPRSY